MLQTVVTYFAMLLFFIVAELVVLSNFMNPLFVRHVGHIMQGQVNFYVAAIFYFVYTAGVFWFASRAGLQADSLFVSLVSGAFLGLIAFGTYELTNFIILKDWKLILVVADTIWGITITAVLAGFGFFIAKLVG